ncbi:MAG: CDP-alcohol phosphatidyltransferase family protein [Phycisphaerales bacterium]|jgi:CDP-diacylglycerol--glycerol-3-phosphate 3-phosphatidyltransferase|nr:CDP-alcohol phosphatidyltransferase family protein [Phycisphaerales bacterium]
MPAGSIRHIPNLLTMARGIMAILFFVAISLYQYPAVGTNWLLIATIVFILAAATDFLDGYLARRWKVVSAFGRVMDPFCDKLLVLGAVVCLAGPRFVVPAWAEAGHPVVLATGLMPWMVVVMLAREFFVTSVRGVAEARGMQCGAKWSGKAKMMLQSAVIPVVMVLLMAAPPGDHPWSEWAIKGLVWAMVAVTVWSGIPYLAVLPTLMRGGESTS